MRGQTVIGLDGFLVGHKKVQSVCDGGQVAESRGAFGGCFGARIREGEKIGESGRNDR